MEENVGGTDRIARLVAGTLLIVAGVAGYTGMLRVANPLLPQALTGLVFLTVGIILLVTGITRYCTINKLLGRNTAG